MHRIKLENKIVDGVVSVGIGIAAYELTAFVMNRAFGVGLPYLPTQITPSNALPAAALLTTDIAVAVL